MDCKEFATHHAAFIDDTLPGFQMPAMREHVTACAKCAKRDTEIRRSLFVLKNLPPIHVSDGFQDKLRERITAEGPAFQGPRRRSPRYMPWTVAAAAVVALAGMKGWYGRDRVSDNSVRLPAVTASAPPAYDHSDASAPEYVASMSTGIPMWPALMLAEEGPLRFAGMQNDIWAASRP